MMLHLFFTFVLMKLVVGKTEEGLTNTKGRKLMMSNECNMLSMLPTERNEGEEYGPEEAYADYLKMGLRPREAAPEDMKQQDKDKEQKQENDEETLWQGIVKKSDDIRDDIITTVYGGKVNTTVASARQVTGSPQTCCVY